MKAMVLEAPSSLALREVERPPLGDGNVLVQVRNTGICGTDQSIYYGGIPVSYPLIMGHEAVGEIVEGEGAGGLGPGSRVILDPVYFCGQCYQCRAGQTNLCPNGGLVGRDRDGGFAEFVTVPAGNVFRLPDGVTDGAAPLIQVLTTCLHAHRLAKIFPGEAVAVIGLGVTGQLHVQLAKARGAHPVIGITRSEWKRDLAEELGADVTAPPGAEAARAIRDATDGRGADLVIECASRVKVLAEAMTLARIGGRVLAYSTYTEKQGELPFYDWYFKELQIINARAAKSEDYPACIDLVQRGQVRLDPLISHTLPLAKLDEALALLTGGGGSRHMKVILDHAV
ncbi:MAG: alcohol dehydrogenase catalytic domain-containing protein [Alphaproteobacteria bacterium]|nr:alcohol dehydrogenase catalytic domain-containing protein [Alphaproteobacteria bacterium]